MLSFKIWKQALLLGAGSKFKIVVVSSAPPVVLALMICITFKVLGKRVVYNVMDIQPEISFSFGDFHNRFGYRLLLLADNWTLKHADMVVVLSDDMKRSLQAERGLHQLAVEVRNNPILYPEQGHPDQVDHVSATEWGMAKRSYGLYMGQVGRFQNLQILVAGFAEAVRLGNSNCDLVIAGSGPLEEQLREWVASERLEERIHILGHVSDSEASDLLESTLFNILSLAPDISRYSFPSKLGTYVVSEKPLLLISDPESDVVALAQRHLEVVSSVPAIATKQEVAEALTSLLAEIEASPRISTRDRTAIDVSLRAWNEGYTEWWKRRLLLLA